MPPRKRSHPPPFSARSSRLPLLRRFRLKSIALWALLITAMVFLFSRLRGGHDRMVSGKPPVVIVTVLEPEAYSSQYLDNIMDNRNEYAAKHDYPLNGAPASWAKVPAVRHAMATFPQATYFWFIDQNALIMNPDITIEQHIMDARRMETLMLRDQPVIPPDSVIKTFPQLRGEYIDLALTQDSEGLVAGSFILRRSEWSKFFLDTWFDPLYRSYNFQKADTHALEHIIQWHPTILSKLALIPQRTMNAYSKGEGASVIYKDGDFVITFANCNAANYADCEIEADTFQRQWRTIFRATR
ncbi:MAG: hypothetical protein M1818_006333 [Claussenomyces sp. TS43310]|nr:MAG: hypothetical protein M1818_006333 [Claussenomyces sp. TS43310]